MQSSEEMQIAIARYHSLQIGLSVNFHEGHHSSWSLHFSNPSPTKASSSANSFSSFFCFLGSSQTLDFFTRCKAASTRLLSERSGAVAGPVLFAFKSAMRCLIWVRERSRALASSNNWERSELSLTRAIR